MLLKLSKRSSYTASSLNSFDILRTIPTCALDYHTRLSLLEQCSLEKRRVVNDLVLLYKFVFRLVDVQTSIFYATKRY